MELTTIWFIVIAFLWVGYFVLEGFDFGVGMLMTILGRDDRERRVLLNTIGPVWDANEVWLIVAAGATFAAFPEWYATLFSGLYLPMLLILLAMIVRIVGIDFRDKRPDASWRRWCDRGILIGSVVPAFLWGLIVANISHGLPIDESGEYVGSLIDVFNPYALLAGAVTLTLSLVHGAFFVGLKTTGEIRTRALSMARRAGAVVAVALAALVIWTVSSNVTFATVALGVGIAIAYAVSGVAAAARHEGWAFTGTAVAIVLLVVLYFVSMFPQVMVSSLDPAWSLTTSSAAASSYTLTIMSWVALAFTPLVLLYQGWSYWVFRRRLGVHHIPDQPVVSSS